jgi:hypothetical protein
MTPSFPAFTTAVSVLSKSSIFSTLCISSSMPSDRAASRAAPVMPLVAGSPRLARTPRAGLRICAQLGRRLGSVFDGELQLKPKAFLVGTRAIADLSLYTPYCRGPKLGHDGRGGRDATDCGLAQNARHVRVRRVLRRASLDPGLDGFVVQWTNPRASWRSRLTCGGRAASPIRNSKSA